VTNEIDFRYSWKFYRGDIQQAELPALDDREWKDVILPHTWNADDMYPGKSTKEAYIGPAWYRKTFTVRRSGRERIFILFEGIANYSEVWVDGSFIGGSDDGFLSFRLDITDALKGDGEHVVAARADNSYRKSLMPPAHTDWERYGGMYRPVWLQVKGPAYFDHKSIRIETPHVSAESARVTIASRVWETERRSRELTIQHRIKDAQGNVIAQAQAPLVAREGRTVASAIEFADIRHPKLWSPDEPHLYSVETLLMEGEDVLDAETNPLGFRWFSFDPQHGFSLNGVPMKLQGINGHQEYPGLGWACPERFHRKEAELLKQAGMNFFRTSHYPRNERFLQACDELGIMVMEEQPYWHGSLRVKDGEELIHNIRRQMSNMVRHHGNHPSIILWNTVNEVMLALNRKVSQHPDPDKRTADMRPEESEAAFMRRALSEMNDELHRADPTRPTSMIVGGAWRLNEEVGLTCLADIVGYNGGSINFSVDKQQGGQRVYDYGKSLDPDRVSIMTEGVVNERTDVLRAEWDKELTLWEDYAGHWQRFYERDWFCGGAMWVFADYSNKGEYRSMGLLDFWRTPYEGYHFFRSIWAKPLMAHICGHWDWPGQEGKTRRVAVFTNGEAAELFLNGKSLGAGQSTKERWPLLPHPPLVWDVSYEPGKLEVIARRNGEETRDVRETSGEPSAIRIWTEDSVIAADGQDVAFISAEIVDAQGRRCYNAYPSLHIETSGACRLAGTSVLEARGGTLRFAVRSTGAEPGKGAIRVSGQGLASGSLSIQCHSDIAN
jgi:beta-galactosidase